jgi:hypothetical protein
MIPTELRNIVQALLDKARANEVNWVPAADLGWGGADNDVVVNFPDYSINVFAGVDPERAEHFIAFNILNSKGKFVHGRSLSPGDNDYAILSEILDLATRKLSGVDEALASLDQVLQQPGAIGLPPGKKAKNAGNDDLPF